MTSDPHSFHLFDALPIEEGMSASVQEAVGKASQKKVAAAIDVEVTELVAPEGDETVRIKGWPDNLRQAPNPLIRCGLFTVGNNKITRAVWGAKKPAKIDAYGSMEVGFHGEEFRQDDLDVLLELLQVVRGQPVDAPALICPLHFIQDMGWTKNNTSYARLKACILRLQMGVITIKIWLDKERTKLLQYNGSLVRDSAFYEDTKAPVANRWSVSLDSKLYQFFELKDYTRLNWDHRKKIHAPLGKFLHAFFSSHNGQVGIPVKQVMALAGYRAQTAQAINKFRYDVHRYLSELEKIGAIQKYTIDDDDKIRVTPVRFSLPKTAKSPKAVAG